MQVKRDPAAEQRFTFTVAGSKTGPDGQGRSDERFVSHSGRIVIGPEHWDVAYALGLAGVKPVPPEFTVRWQVVPHFVDEVLPVAAADPSVETVVTVAQGLPGRRHTLEIAGSSDAPLAAVRRVPAAAGGHGQVTWDRLPACRCGRSPTEPPRPTAGLPEAPETSRSAVSAGSETTPKAKKETCGAEVSRKTRTMPRTIPMVCHGVMCGSGGNDTIRARCGRMQRSESRFGPRRDGERAI